MITMVRDVDLTRGEFVVYKNLRDGSWSICAVKGSGGRGLLVARADKLVLYGARAVVKESRRAAIQAGADREVCAWFVGSLVDNGHVDADGPAIARVTFRPREHRAFFRVDTGVDVWSADRVSFDASGNAWLI